MISMISMLLKVIQTHSFSDGERSREPIMLTRVVTNRGVSVCVFQVAMQRAKVCVRFVNVSGENHLRLVKAKDMQPEIADHEAAYLDNTGKDKDVIYT